MAVTHAPTDAISERPARPVLVGGGHALHSYFNACPESPDGRTIVAFVSTQPEGHFGDIVIIDRAAGGRTVLAGGVEADDSHRQAHQQWIDGGSAIVFQNRVGGRWQVERIDVRNGARRVLLRDRLLGWSQPGAVIVPVYGPHWEPGGHTGLELLDVRTGDVTPAITLEQVRRAAPAITSAFPADRPLSIFFPVLSPDLSRVFFKLSSPTGAGFRAADASLRQGLIVWSLAEQRCLGHAPNWGHPSWHPDSRTIVNVDNQWLDTDSMTTRTIDFLPRFRGSHPSVSPDHRWLATDTYLSAFGGEKGRWGVALADLVNRSWCIVHRAPVIGGGTTSHRPPHPHPAFSADSRRLYFNVNLGTHTVLHLMDLP